VKLYKRFIRDVRKFKSERYCKETIAAVDRHLKDIQDSKKKSFEYFFDEEMADAVIDITFDLNHTMDSWNGKPFNLQSWQAFFLASVYGWYHKKEPNRRRFTEAFLSIARKNGKSEFAAVPCVLEQFFTQRKGEIYSIATMHDQASITLERASSMLEMLARKSISIRKDLRITGGKQTDRIINKKTKTFFRALSNQYNKFDGKFPTMVVVDEYHEHKSSRGKEVMQSGMVSAFNSLLLVTTTAGFTINGPCHRYQKTCTDILYGKKKDDTLFALIFKLDSKKEINNPKKWIKANPSMSGIPTLLAGLKREYAKAKNEGAEKWSSFVTKNLNLWVSTKSVFIPDDFIKPSKQKYSIKDLMGRECFAGFDLASDQDITAASFFFPSSKAREKNKFVNYYFIAEDNAMERARKDGVPYLD
jgi:phage terminase large subunit-like protein